MTGRLWRRLRRNAGSVAAVVVRDVLARPRNAVGLVLGGVGLLVLVHAGGALLAGGVVSAAVLGVVGLAAAYGAGTSVLGRPLRGIGVALAVLVVVGGGAHTLGVAPPALDGDASGVEGAASDDVGGWAERDHTVHVGEDGLNAHEDEGGGGEVVLSTRSDRYLDG